MNPLFFYLFFFLFSYNSQALGHICFNYEDRFPPIPDLSSFELVVCGARLEKGAYPDDHLNWAAARQMIPTDFKLIETWLRDHWNWKNKENTKMHINSIKKAGLSQLDELFLDVNVWGFIWLSWVEQWAYQNFPKTEKREKQILVTYQKISGTPHLPHLCGMIYLQKKLKNTDLFFYEEAISKNYKALDILKMHRDNLGLLEQLGRK